MLLQWVLRVFARNISEILGEIIEMSLLAIAWHVPRTLSHPTPPPPVSPFGLPDLIVALLLGWYRAVESMLH